MSTWRVGTMVCSGCGAVLSIKSLSDKIPCYLCNASLDLTDCPISEEPYITKDYGNKD